MTIWTDLLFLLVVAVGLVGVIIPMLPGTLLIAGAAIAWAVTVRETVGWVVLAVVLVVLALGAVVKYAVPGQRLKRAGIPNSTLLAGGVLGIVGFFVIPIVGLPIGFVAGVFLAEARRSRLPAPAPVDGGPAAPRPSARASTWSAVLAVLLSVAIELSAGLVAAAALVVGAVTT